ncbi:uncharacterized protein ACR2FA_010653 [Aphomia sociella]
MDFARKQLEKYGWTDGKGLGKHENGISEALKPRLKRSVTGVGHDAASDFTEHWWSQLYDKAAGNVQVEEVNGKTKKIKANSDSFEITNSTWRLNKKKKDNSDGEYSEYFVKKAVLTNGGRKVENFNESDSEDEVQKKDVFKLTDEELFAACGGRTAHKGARHGLKAIGKLARIAQQEQTLLKQPQFTGYSHAEKLKQGISAKDSQVVEDMNLDSDVDMSVKRKNKKKKKRKHCVSQNSESENVDMSNNEAEENHTLLLDNIIKKNKNVTTNVASKDADEIISKKSKKSKRKKECLDTDIYNTEITEDIVIVKKCKKIKQKDIEEIKPIIAMETDSAEKWEEQMVVENYEKKKRKKKRLTTSE